MRFLITMPQGRNFEKYFPPHLIKRLEKLGEVVTNPTDRQFSRSELSALLQGTDIVLTHWGCKQIDGEILDNAPRLKMVAHCAGTVAHIASKECYERNIPVLSANPIMAKYVAEWVLGAIISALREFNRLDGLMKQGVWQTNEPSSLFDREIGLIGLGTVGKNLLDMLSAFGCRVKVFDPYIPKNALDKWSFAQASTFEQAMKCSIVSIHAAQTPETFHMVDARALAMIPDGGLLVNSARGSLIDTEALIAQLASSRIYAALDVYDREWCAQDERLLACKNNTLLLPHIAALPAGSRMTEEIIGDIERFINAQALQYQVSLSQYIHMTQE